MRREDIPEQDRMPIGCAIIVVIMFLVMLLMELSMTWDMIKFPYRVLFGD